MILQRRRILTISNHTEYITLTDKSDQGIDVVDVQIGVFWAEGHTRPQATVVRHEAPFLTHAGDVAKLTVPQKTEHVQQNLVRQFVDTFLSKSLIGMVIFFSHLHVLQKLIALDKFTLFALSHV